MNAQSKEADARILIDDQLRAAGWNPADKSQVLTEVSVSGGHHVAEPGAQATVLNTADGDAIPTGRADYVLLDQRGRPLAIIEAKKQAIQPYTAKQQALPYAKQIGAPFIFLTNGELIYFWDYQNDDARIVNSFFSRRDLERLVHMRAERKPLATVPIPDNYLRQGETRILRPYQKEAMQALDRTVELGKRRFLIELPTGCGKTDLIALYLKRLVQAGHAERILFLVDRDQLAKQAIEAIQDLLPGYSSYWLKPGMVRQEKQITVCLLQTMIGRYQEFTSGYFDVVVADECHRSIYGAWQTALTHFDALHIDLTATPAIYIERNTFQFYHCKDDTPDYSYPIQEAFKEGFLVPYKFATGITELVSEGADVDEEHYDPAEFERKWTNEASNRLMMEEFDRLAWQNYQELAPGQKVGPGKSVVFAITKHHAARLAQYLNELHPEHKGRYAEVITSDVANADDLIRRFKQEELPMVAVSVGMLDTGFDCREVLHLVMCRRIRSPILYQQMRGRGTRTAPHIGKEKFVIYDFFRNHEYFNDSDTGIFSGSGGGGYAPKAKPPGGKTPRELIELGLEDEWLDAVHYIEVGPDGERVDKRDYVTDWETTVREAVNGWLGSSKLKTPYKLVVRSLVALDQLQTPLEEGLERLQDGGLDMEPDYDYDPAEKQSFVTGEYPVIKDVETAATGLLAGLEESDADRIRELVLVDQRTNTVVTHRDVGIGISQVLPVLVMAYGSQGKLLAMEQPEIHLHPALQAELGDVFIEAALGSRQNTFILETHSEHLILRLMRRIREGKISPDDVGVVFVEPLERGSRFIELRIDEEGDFIDEWPGGFFEESFYEKFAGR